MPTRTDPGLRMREQPHPLVTIAAVLIVFGLVFMGLMGDPGHRIVYGVVAIVVAIAFQPLRRRSAARQRLRREQELERLRHQRVLHLDD